MRSGFVSSTASSHQKTPLKQKRRFLNHEASIPGILDKNVFAKISILKQLSSKKNNPVQPLPMQLLSADDFANMPDQKLSVRWMGHSFLLIEWCGLRFLTDPVFQNAAPVPDIIPRYQNPPIQRSELPEIDFVLLSHNHYDHLEKGTIRLLKKRGCFFIVPSRLEKILKLWGVKSGKIISMQWGSSIRIADLEICMTEARHFSGRTLLDKNKTLWASYVIRHNKQAIFFGGDGGYGKHFQEIGNEFGPFELAFLEIDAWNERWPSVHMTPAEAILAARDLKARKLFPIHWGVFNLANHPWNESIEKLWQIAGKEKFPLLTPVMGQKIYPETDSTEKWWDLP